MTILTPVGIYALARTAGFNDDKSPDLTIAIAIALAESGGRTDAVHVNTNGSTDYGLWQINSIHSDLLSKYRWADPQQNALMAFTVFADAGYKWTPWSTYKSGAFQRYMSAARAADSSGMWIVVAAGDTLSHIAEKWRGDARDWPVIWHDTHNAGLVHLRGTPDRIQPGDHLYVPLS